MCVSLGQTQLFLNFKDAHPECRIKQRAFEYLKPWYVRTLKDQSTCCCIYHTEMDMMRTGLNDLRSCSRGLHSSQSCNCAWNICGDGEGHCEAHSHAFERLTILWTSCLCPKGDFDKWHKLDCLMGNCVECGVKKLDFCPQELSFSINQTIKWKCFEQVVIGVHEDTGRDSKRIQQVHKETSPGEFVSYLKAKVGNFITHNFVANWQDCECRKMMQHVPQGVLISHIDFAENYSFAIYNEIQSMHWYSTSITILDHITLWRLPPSAAGEDGGIQK